MCIYLDVRKVGPFVYLSRKKRVSRNLFVETSWLPSKQESNALVGEGGGGEGRGCNVLYMA